jgi:spore germination cell wall hydrolase CwlJ-like protein
MGLDVQWNLLGAPIDIAGNVMRSFDEGQARGERFRAIRDRRNLRAAVSAFARSSSRRAAAQTSAKTIRLPLQIASLLMGDQLLSGTRRVPTAAPFQLPDVDTASSVRALNCLTAAVYFEARSEAAEGQRAVAQVVLNRVRHYAYPSSICGVVFQGPMRAGGGCQFTFTCDGSLSERHDPAAWARAKAIARAALSGEVEERVGWATHYHTDYVSPWWGRKLLQVAVLGTHIFYRNPGAAGEPKAFVRRSASLEPATARIGAIEALMR